MSQGKTIHEAMMEGTLNTVTTRYRQRTRKPMKETGQQKEPVKTSSSTTRTHKYMQIKQTDNSLLSESVTDAVHVITKHS